MARTIMTETADNGAEVYRHDINLYCTQYIEERLKLNPDDMTEEDIKIVHDNFTDMIFYISDRIPRPDTADIATLDHIFDVYVRLCTRFKVLPTLECFSFLVKINRCTFTDWRNGGHRASTAHSNTVKKWKNLCKSALIDNLTNTPGGSINRIFIAKSVFGLTETAPVPTLTQDPRNSVESVETIKARHMLTADEPLLSADDIRP